MQDNGKNNRKNEERKLRIIRNRIEKLGDEVRDKLEASFSDQRVADAMLNYAPAPFLLHDYIRHLLWLQKASIDDIDKWFVRHETPSAMRKHPADEINDAIIGRIKDRVANLLKRADGIIQDLVSEPSPSLTVEQAEKLGNWLSDFKHTRDALCFTTGQNISIVPDAVCEEPIGAEEFIDVETIIFVHPEDLIRS